MIVKRILSVVTMAAFLALPLGVVRGETEWDDASWKGPATAEDKKSHDLSGSWLVTTTPLGGPPPFQGLITFDAGGGLVASAQGDILLNAPPGVPPIATAGHGAWARTGQREFLFTFRQLYYDADGGFQGGAKIRMAVNLNRAGNEWSGQLTVDYLDSDGNVVFSGAGTAQAIRIMVEPLGP